VADTPLNGANFGDIVDFRFSYAVISIRGGSSMANTPHHGQMTAVQTSGA